MWTLFLSIRYFLSRRKEGMISLIGAISVLGVALGVASLIIVLSVMNGFDREIRDKIIGTYAHMTVMKEGGVYDSDRVIGRLEKRPEVMGASAFITGQAVLRKNDRATGVLIKAIDPVREPRVSEVIEYTKLVGDDLSGRTIVLGSELMRAEGVMIGDEVELLIPYSAVDLEKARLRVIGSFTSGRYDYDSNIAVIGLDTAADIFRTDGAVSGVSLRLADGMDVERVKSDLQRELGVLYSVKSWMDLDRNLVSALALEKKMMFLILALIVTVACFNISSSLIMMVMEKTRDIGILRALGATAGGVRAVFFIEGAIIGVLGIMAGGAAGMFISSHINEAAAWLEKITGTPVFPSDVYYFTEIPVLVSPSDVTSVIGVAVLLTLLAGIYPAWKASRLMPVQAIRYE